LTHSKQPSPIANFSGQIESLQRLEGKKISSYFKEVFGDKSLAKTAFSEPSPHPADCTLLISIQFKSNEK